jgi:hypothetical protein
VAFTNVFKMSGLQIESNMIQRKAKKKPDLSKNPDKVDTSVRRILLESGKVKILKK